MPSPLAEVPIALNRRRVLLVFSGLMAGLFLSALDQNVVATALPTIVGDLHGANHLAWVVTAYLLTSTVSTPLWGKLGDLYGRKWFFQAAIVIFLAGSVLAGISTSMGELIAFRAIQGLGGGGLMVGAQAIIGDIVAPRDRGRYVGLFGMMFGIATVLGPLVGGLFVEYWNWRWVFFVNVPVGLVALAITAAVLPGKLRTVPHQVDYLGITLLAAGVSGLVLLTSLGGSSFAWLSPESISLALASLLALLGFVGVERRAVEPVVPMRLFANRAFTTASAVGFVVGLAMYGALVFMPLFLQVVKGVSPTQSGFRLIWLMGGLFAMSIFSGQVISRGWRYRPFPIFGTATMTLGLYLMGRVGVETATWVMDLYMFVFGIGLGAVMQVLVLVVQNAVPYQDLGVATSGATFFRSIGGSFGTAIFGAIYNAAFAAQLNRYVPGSADGGVNLSAALSPERVGDLPPGILAGVREAVAASVQTVYHWAIPLGALAFALSWLIPEGKLRGSLAEGQAPGEALRPTGSASSAETLEQLVARIAARGNRAAIYANLAERAGLDLGAQGCWLLLRIAEHEGLERTELESLLHLADEHVAAGFAQLEAAGLVGEAPGLRLTEDGQHATAALRSAREAGLRELLEGWDVAGDPEVEAMVRRLAAGLLADDDRLVADLRRA